MTVSPAEPEGAPKIIFASVDAAIAREMEPKFAAAGCAVISNSSAFRMAPNVPLVLPEVNADHLHLIEEQPSRKESGGYIVTNSNCSAMGLVLALKPIEERFGIEQIFVTTMQAVSRRGLSRRGVDGHSGQRDSVHRQRRRKDGDGDAEAAGQARGPCGDAAQREDDGALQSRPVVDGHTECVSIKLGKKLGREATREDILAAWAEFKPLAGLDCRQRRSSRSSGRSRTIARSRGSIATAARA
jgi:aspartate-semialdehyde dehydrogenase